MLVLHGLSCLKQLSLLMSPRLHVLWPQTPARHLAQAAAMKATLKARSGRTIKPVSCAVAVRLFTSDSSLNSALPGGSLA